jgi:DMSO/TMAO reductase YedYZ heme-binding membrane subunit
MHIVAFIVAVLAVVLFAVEWFRTRSLLAAGLALFAAAFILVHTLEHEGADLVTFG